MIPSCEAPLSRFEEVSSMSGALMLPSGIGRSAMMPTRDGLAGLPGATA
jgi:hypothetical protein